MRLELILRFNETLKLFFSHKFFCNLQVEKKIQARKAKQPLRRNKSLNDLEKMESQQPKYGSSRKRSLSVGYVSETNLDTKNNKGKLTPLKKSLIKIGKLCKNLQHKSDSAVTKQKKLFLKSISASAINEKCSVMERVRSQEHVATVGGTVDKFSQSCPVTDRKKGQSKVGQQYVSGSVSASSLYQGLAGDHQPVRRHSRKRMLTRMIKSTGDIVKPKVLLPLDPRPKSKSTSSLVKKFINGGRKLTGKKKEKQTNDFPTLMMQGFKSVNSLLTVVADSIEEETGELVHDIGDNNDHTEIVNDVGEDTADIDIGKTKTDDIVKGEGVDKDVTLTKTFGDRTTVIKYALSEACDVATAAITPVSDGKEIKNQSQKLERRNTKMIFIRRSKTGIDLERLQMRKKKAYSDPPRLANSLFSTCQMFTAFAQADFASDTPSTRENNILVKSDESKGEETVENADFEGHEYMNLDELSRNDYERLDDDISETSEQEYVTNEVPSDKDEIDSGIETKKAAAGIEIKNNEEETEQAEGDNQKDVKKSDKHEIDLDKDGYIPMDKPKKRIPPSYPPPPLIIKTLNKKKPDKIETLHSLCQAAHLGTVFANIDLEKDQDECKESDKDNVGADDICRGESDFIDNDTKGIEALNEKKIKTYKNKPLVKQDSGYGKSVDIEGEQVYKTQDIEQEVDDVLKGGKHGRVVKVQRQNKIQLDENQNVIDPIEDFKGSSYESFEDGIDDIVENYETVVDPCNGTEFKEPQEKNLVYQEACIIAKTVDAW